MGSSVSSRPPSRVSRKGPSRAVSAATINETTGGKGPTSPNKKVDQNRINEELKSKEGADDNAVNETKDVMISYSHAEMDKMKRIKGKGQWRIQDCLEGGAQT